MDEPKKPRRRKKDPDTLYCSFCKKSQHEISKLIAGPKVYICDECIDTCNEIIAEEELALAKTKPAALVKYIETQRERVDMALDRIGQASSWLTSSLAAGTDTRH